MNNENRMNNLKELNAFNRNIYLNSATQKKKAFFSEFKKMFNYHLCHNLLLCMHILCTYKKCHELHLYEGNSWQKIRSFKFLIQLNSTHDL